MEILCNVLYFKESLINGKRKLNFEESLIYKKESIIFLRNYFKYPFGAP